jgi:transcriptional regulator with XRE-family HTH domain
VPRPPHIEVNKRFKQLVIEFNGGLVEGAQSKFARAVGVSSHSVNQWVMGIHTPSSLVRVRIASELNLPLSEIEEMFSRQAIARQSETPGQYPRLKRLKVEQGKIVELEILFD